MFAACEPGEEPGTTYSISVTAGDGGTAAATVDGKEISAAEEGATVTLVASAAEGYVFEKWTTESNGVAFKDETAIYTTFTMPAGDVSIEAEFRPANGTVYTVTVTDDGHGTAVATIDGGEVTEAAEGVTVTITATPDSGYLFEKWIAESEGVSIKNPVAALTTFVMPAGDVHIKAEFMKVPNTITFTGTGGTAVATVDGNNVTVAEEGATVTITAMPGGGYTFEKWTTESEGVALADDTAVSTTFTMPGHAVVIGIKFVDTYSDVLSQITDPAFKAYCEYVMVNSYQYMDPITGTFPSHPAWDTNGNGFLSSGEAAAVRAINIQRSGGAQAILSLEGIEVFSGLENFSCGSHNVTSVDMTENTELVVLYLNYTPATVLDVEGCSKLKYVVCNNNSLEELNLSGCTSLGYLDCFLNRLTSIDLSDSASLTYMNCANNQLGSLDLSNNAALRSLQCNNNSLTSLDITGNPAIKNVLCYNNQLVSLTVSGNNTALEGLQCNNNSLATLDVSWCTSLYELQCANNLLTALDLSGCTTLFRLRCEDNRLPSLDMYDCTKIEYLYCNNNRMQELDITNMPITYEGNYHAIVGVQTTDGTTARQMRLTVREEQKPHWNNNLSDVVRYPQNANVVLAN